MRLLVEGQTALQGTLRVPADKSMTHRALLMAALCDGESEITAPRVGEDNRSTARALAALGVELAFADDVWRVRGRGAAGLVPPSTPVDCGNSGTTIRLLAGLLAGAGVPATLAGDASLARRPMGRICAPLRALGADLAGELDARARELPPLHIRRGGFRGGVIDLDIASAQVKSGLLLAGVASGHSVTLSEPAASRDHTERLLTALGAAVATTRDLKGRVRVELAAGAALSPLAWRVPGDFSSAVFALGAALLVPGSKVTVCDVGVNATRTGLLETFEEYGARCVVREWREESGEPVASLTAEASALRATRPGGGALRVDGDAIPRLIDELVLLAALASQAEGETLVADARELRVKESDRVAETVRLLAAFGVQARERDDGFAVNGPQALHAAHVDVSADHRLALTAAVLALAAPGESVLDGFEIAAISYPDFVAALTSLGARLRVRDA